jgi:hypothetical protein
MMHMVSLIIFAIIALIIATILGILCSVVAGVIVRRRNWSHKWLIVLSAAITPAMFIGMEAVLGLIGSVYISETKGVDWGFGDYWQAPLTESYYLYAIDMPEKAAINSRDNDRNFEGSVKHLWVAEDSILAACYSSGDNYSLYAFHVQDSGIDTIVNRADSLQFAKALQNRNMDIKTALAPDEYFDRAQKEAHKTESLVRHTIVIAILLALWAVILRFTKKKECKP